MLETRIIKAEWGDTHIQKTATRGTPQGGVISPLLWILTVDEILKDMRTNGVKIEAYADDVVIIVTGKFLNTLSELLESALKKFSNGPIARDLI